MRTIILGLFAIAALALSTSDANAHLHAKTWILQGTVSFSSSSGDLYGDESMTVISFAPTVHYAIINKLALGGMIDINSRSQGDVSATSLNIGPSLRYFFGSNSVDPHKGTINPFLGAAILMRSESFDDGNSLTDEESASGSAIQLAGGFAWFLRESLALTPELSVNLESLEGETGTTIRLGVGLAGWLDYHH